MENLIVILIGLICVVSAIEWNKRRLKRKREAEKKLSDELMNRIEPIRPVYSRVPNGGLYRGYYGDYPSSTKRNDNTGATNGYPSPSSSSSDSDWMPNRSFNDDYSSGSSHHDSGSSSTNDDFSFGGGSFGGGGGGDSYDSGSSDSGSSYDSGSSDSGSSDSSSSND